MNAPLHSRSQNSNPNSLVPTAYKPTPALTKNCIPRPTCRPRETQAPAGPDDPKDIKDDQKDDKNGEGENDGDNKDKNGDAKDDKNGQMNKNMNRRVVERKSGICWLGPHV